MKTKIFYTSSGGETRVETIRPHTQLVEMPDGLHALSKHTVYRNIDDKREAMVFIWQDVTAPEGGAVTESYLKNIEVTKQHRMKPHISKYWVRRWNRGFLWFGRLLYFGMFLSMIALGFWIIYLLVTL